MRVTRDHAASGFDLESQVAESINKHFNDVLRDDIIAHNLGSEEIKKEDAEGENDSVVASCEYEISDTELQQMNMNADFPDASANFHF